MESLTTQVPFKDVAGERWLVLELLRSWSGGGTWRQVPAFDAAAPRHRTVSTATHPFELGHLHLWLVARGVST